MAPPVSPQNPWFQVSEIVRLIRSGQAETRPELADTTRLGRNVITQRIQEASALGLIEPGGTGRSRGGRAAGVWRFRGEVGHVLVGMIGSHRFRVALADLGGRVLEQTDVEWPVGRGPEDSCRRMAEEMSALLTRAGVDRPWGVAIGLPAPVDFVRGRSVDPVAPTQDLYRWPREFDVRDWFTTRFAAPAWTDAISNLMALGAAGAPGAPDDLVFVRLGTGLGAGIVSGGRVHRGATWVAGELNHVTVVDDPERTCLCGRTGCLDTFAGGWAMLLDARRAAAAGRSPYLAAAVERGTLTVDTIADGAADGDHACVEIVRRTADALGRVLAGMVTWFNPAEVVVGGFRFAQSDLFRTVLDRSVRASALTASVADLRIRAGDPDQAEGIRGAVELVTNSLLSPEYLAQWGPAGSPPSAPALLTRTDQI